MGKRVLVGMSGGVDSAASALLLKEQGYDVTGVTLLLHDCGNGEKDAQDAARVAAHIGVPHITLDLSDTFQKEVMQRFVDEYRAGNTPNPCIDCNREIKFGAMLEWALAQGFDYIATGHYARVDFDEKHGLYRLLRGSDRAKDQSYVLYQLTQKELSHLLLPLGEYDKESVRAIAARAGLESANRPDSQDICFVPDGDYVRFLCDFGGVSLEEGAFVDETGRVLGRHRGLAAYTTGQRKGLGVSADRPLYVLSKNAADNTVLLGDNEQLFSSSLLGKNASWTMAAPSAPIRATAKTRYSQKEAAASVSVEGDTVRVVFDEPQRAITAGQAVVFYDGETVLGGATIDRAL